VQTNEENRAMACLLVVDAHAHVLLDMLVQSPDAVVDHLTAITGLSAQSMAGVTAT
jgi:hypothetical protein